ncbi:phosphotransferase family protein [Aeromicrobium sp. Sec7.5]|uniref:phosphotransferase family protein n=1 Tax=Aeromicrobium sp. Sec7.5 TaxID=3121276 RepID=UPI002FE44DCF
MTEGIAGVDHAVLEQWLSRHASVTVPVRARLLTGARSNLTYLLEAADGQRYALRRPPTGAVLASAHDMAREWRFISALADTPVPVARPVAWCDDREVSDADLYVMSFVEGVVLDSESSAGAMAGPVRRRASEDLVRVLAELHAVDAEALGLGDRQRAEGYVARQLKRWSAQIELLDPPERATLLEGAALLGDRIPPQRTGVVHGDFRPGNLALGPDGAVRAVFDWELATVGDVHADLGWLVATWAEPGKDLPRLIVGPTGDGGFLTRAELVAAYEKAAGATVPDLDFYVAFAHWRLCCITVGVRHRYQEGAMADDGFDGESLTEGIGWWSQRVVEMMAR